MGYPKNPDPKGIKEIDIWNYYMSVKSSLVKEVSGRDLFVYIMTDKGPVLVRKGKTTKYIRLNASNYEQVITGRTISIHSSMRRTESIGIVDIDCDNFRLAKIAAFETFNEIAAEFSILDRVTIHFTGKTGFHIFCKIRGRANIDSIRFLLRKFLMGTNLAKKYTIESKRTSGIPNLDLAPNKFRGGYVSLHSLSTIGLKCMEIKPTELLRFEPHRARIKI